MREPTADLLTRVFREGSRSEVAVSERPVVVVAESPVSVPDSAPQVATVPAAAIPTDSLVMSAANGALANADTVEWTPAVARTWVNVRYDASKGSDVVGVIKPSEKAMLGEYGRDGWRQVKSPEVSGWVDPRHFEADSLRSRG